MNIIEKDSSFFVEKNGKVCMFNHLRGAEYMLEMLKLMDNNKIPELDLVFIDDNQFNIKYNYEYLSKLRSWILKYTLFSSDFYEDDCYNINFLMDNRAIAMSPYSSSFVVSYENDYEFENGREAIFKAPRTEQDFIDLINQI